MRVDLDEREVPSRHSKCTVLGVSCHSPSRCSSVIEVLDASGRYSVNNLDEQVDPDECEVPSLHSKCTVFGVSQT